MVSFTAGRLPWALRITSLAEYGKSMGLRGYKKLWLHCLATLNTVTQQG